MTSQGVSRYETIRLAIVLAGSLSIVVGVALLSSGCLYNLPTVGKNIFMNGALLGLKREFIQSKFDEIVEFSEIRDIIDIPVEKYSSGMYAQLRFAVSSIVEPDILIIDEVLAVVDEAFQRKCFAMINNLRNQGVSIIFVSHSPTAIIEFCNRAILKDEGEIILTGQPKFIVLKYHQMLFATPESRKMLRGHFKSLSIEKVITEAAAKEPRGVQNVVRNSYDGLNESYDEDFKPKITFSYLARSFRGVIIKDPKILSVNG